MINFRNTNIIFMILLVILVVVDLRFPVSILFYLLIILLYSAILFYGTYYIGSNFYIKVLCSASTTDKLIAISFDDGPSKKYTPQILDILKEQNVSASFFCIGKNIEGNEKILQDILEGDHLVGNHSYTHNFLFDLYSSKRMYNDLELMSSSMQSATGLRPKLFRPPYGVTNPNLARAIKKGNLTPVGWNVRSMDTVSTDENKLLKRMTKRIAPGSIFLFHDTMDTTVKILPSFIMDAKKKGYKLVRIDELLKIQAYE